MSENPTLVLQSKELCSGDELSRQCREAHDNAECPPCPLRSSKAICFFLSTCSIRLFRCSLSRCSCSRCLRVAALSALFLSSTSASFLECVHQSHFGSQFAFRHFNLQIEMKIGAQMRTFIPHLKPFLSSSKLKIDMKWSTMRLSQ